MVRRTLAALSAGVLVTSLTSPVYAQPRVQSQTRGHFTTRSGASLQGLENRSISQDFPAFLPASSSVSVPQPVVRESAESSEKPQSVTVFGQTIELGSRGDSKNSGNKAPSHLEMRNIEFSAGASATDSEELLRVQYQLMNSEQK